MLTVEEKSTQREGAALCTLLSYCVGTFEMHFRGAFAGKRRAFVVRSALLRKRRRCRVPCGLRVAPSRGQTTMLFGSERSRRLMIVAGTTDHRATEDHRRIGELR